MAYDFFKDFQAAIVGVIGFAIGIFTLWWNAHEVRRTHSLEFQETRQTMRTALREELTLIESDLKLVDEYAKRESREQLLIYLSHPDVYKSLVHNIGILEPREVEKLVRAYGRIETARNLPAIEGQRAIAAHELLRYSEPLPSWLAQYVSGCLGTIRAAIDVLC